MIPVDQTLFGWPGGNCLAACLASLLEVRLDEVPRFGEEFLEVLQAWLAPRGMYALCISVRGGYPQGLHILSGKGPRDLGDERVLHSVVARGAQIVHDPHPSRAGLLTHEDSLVLVLFDPRSSQ